MSVQETSFKSPAAGAPASVGLSRAEFIRLDPGHVVPWETNWTDRLVRAPMLPTVQPTDVDTLCRYADLLHEEDYPALEILSRPLDQALAVLEQINQRPQRSKIRWGLGTMRFPVDATSAAKLQPDFLVSPAFSPRVLQVAVETGIPYIPGVHTFQDVQNVLDAFDSHGLKVRLLKLCPIFGLTQQYIEALCSCFPGISFCPTGEVELDNYLHWKQMPGIVAPMGSKFVPRGLLETGDWPAVRVQLRQIRALAETAAQTDPAP